VEKQLQIIERIIEKEPKIIKEAPDYDNIPEEIILKEKSEKDKCRQVSRDKTGKKKA
jgi:hypothetical protein